MTEHEVRSVVEAHLPGFVEACKHSKDTIVMTQGAFEMEDDEVTLLGAAIKYAGYHKKVIQVVP